MLAQVLVYKCTFSAHLEVQRSVRWMVVEVLVYKRTFLGAEVW